jgi:hypothetical protein
MQIFVVYLRYLIGLAFILAALFMGKLNNTHPFTLTIDLNKVPPIALFFHVLTIKPLYWHFIGWFQIITGILLVTQRFARLGTLLFFGMMVNIWLITITYEFYGTPVVTGLMCLAALALLIWEYEAYLPMLNISVKQPPKSSIEKHPYWQLLGIILILTAVFCHFFVKSLLVFVLPLLVGIIGLLIFINKNKLFKNEK